MIDPGEFLKWCEVFGIFSGGITPISEIFFNANVVTRDGSPIVLTNPLANVQIITLLNNGIVLLPAMNNQIPPWKGRNILVFNNAMGNTTNATEFSIGAQDGITSIYERVLFQQGVLLYCIDDTTPNGTFIPVPIPNGRLRRFGQDGGTIDTTFLGSVCEANMSGSAFVAPLIDTAGMVTGFNFWLKNNSTGNITFTADSPNTIDGQSVLTLAPTESAWILCNGVNWETISLGRSINGIGNAFFNANVVSHSSTPLVLTNPLANVQNLTLSFTNTVQFPAMNGQTPAWKGRDILVRNSGVLSVNSPFNIVAQDGSTSIYDGLECGQTVLLTVTDDSTANGTFLANLIPNGEIIRRGSTGGSIDRADYFGIVVEATAAAANFTAPAIGTGLMKSGYHFWLKNLSTGNITFTPTSPNLVDGKAYLSLSPNESAHILCNGALWETIALSRLGETEVIEVTGTSQTISQNNRYIANNAGLVTFALPALAQKGSYFEIIGQGAGGWKQGQGVGQQVNYNATQTTLGTGGSISSTARYNCARYTCVLENLLWTVTHAEGNLDAL